jgi:iron complex outermembrane receptor protein
MRVQPFNSINGESYGGEAVVAVAPTDSWRLSASYSLLFLHAHGQPAADAAPLESNAPTHQFVLRSSHDLGRRVSLDGQLRYVDNVSGVPAYFTGDVRLAWRPMDNLEFSLVGQNLLQDRHPEQSSVIGAPTIEVPRGIYGKLTWQF